MSVYFLICQMRERLEEMTSDVLNAFQVEMMENLIDPSGDM